MPPTVELSASVIGPENVPAFALLLVITPAGLSANPAPVTVSGSAPFQLTPFRSIVAPLAMNVPAVVEPQGARAASGRQGAGVNENLPGECGEVTGTVAEAQRSSPGLGQIARALQFRVARRGSITRSVVNRENRS